MSNTRKMKTKSTKSEIAEVPDELVNKRLFNAPELFGNQNEIKISHNGDIYTLRITRNGKLVMNK